jgi:hypothetical protein
VFQTPLNPHPARLFQCSNAKGYFTVEAIPDFIQFDLIEEDVMLLDSWDVLFLWIGSKSNREERTMAMSLAEDYLRTHPSGSRDMFTPIVVLKQGLEPVTFTGFFGIWDQSMWANKSSFDDFRRESRAMRNSRVTGDGSDSVVPIGGGGNGMGVTSGGTYPAEVLRTKDPLELPEEVDPTKKETYLSPDEFQAIFGMSSDKFQSLPEWRRIKIKKDVGLF